MFIAGVIYSSAVLLFYLFWFIFFPTNLSYIYDYTVMCDLLIICGCLLMDTAKSDKLLNYALAACSLMSVALRYVNRDCDCNDLCDDDACLYNSCCSLRSYTHLVMLLVPVATAGVRIISIRRFRNNV